VPVRPRPYRPCQGLGGAPPGLGGLDPLRAGPLAPAAARPPTRSTAPSSSSRRPSRPCCGGERVRAPSSLRSARGGALDRRWPAVSKVNRTKPRERRRLASPCRPSGEGLQGVARALPPAPRRCRASPRGSPGQGEDRCPRVRSGTAAIRRSSSRTNRRRRRPSRRWPRCTSGRHSACEEEVGRGGGRHPAASRPSARDATGKNETRIVESLRRRVRPLGPSLPLPAATVNGGLDDRPLA
jgi:hypothetical protein